MPFTSNTTQGTVSYQPSGFFNQGAIVANDGSALIHTALTAVSEFAIPMGKYERVLGEIALWYDSDNTSEFKFKFKNEDSSGTAIASTMHYSASGIVTFDTDADITASAGIEAVAVTNTDGDGAVITLDAGSSETDARFARISFNVISNAATNGTLNFYAGEIADAADCHLLAGSYIAYKKF
tara:strand:+ start:463 stop:1008 length:546 start_codon:yes stop_codon:yes gene_type:complete